MYPSTVKEGPWTPAPSCVHAYAWKVFYAGMTQVAYGEGISFLLPNVVKIFSGSCEMCSHLTGGYKFVPCHCIRKRDMHTLWIVQ